MKNILVKELPLSERPREKAIKFGIDTLSNRELLAIIIRSGIKGHSSLDIADNILKYADGINKLINLNLNELMKIKGIKEAKAIELLACFELIKRISFVNVETLKNIDNPHLVHEWLIIKIGGIKQECFYVIFMNVKNHIIGFKKVFQGTLNASLVHPREIFKEAILKSASKIIVAHNHPSSDLTPSPADIEVTKQLKNAGDLIGIKLIDHLIVNDYNYFSFNENGML